MKKVTLSLTALVLGLFLLQLNASEALAIPIGPDKYYLDVSAGQVIEEELTIYGREQLSAPRDLFVYPVGMRKTGEEHDRSFYEADANDLTEVANWITMSTEKFTLVPGDTVVIPWTMRVPDFVACGTQLAALKVGTSPKSDTNETGESQIALNTEVISQVHVTVTSTDGRECPEEDVRYTLLDFKLSQDFPLFNYDGQEFLTRVENNGSTIGREPKGFIELFGFGERVTIPFNDEGYDIYPSTVRKFSDVWDDPNYPDDGNFFSKLIYEVLHLRVGKYEARLGITKNTDVDMISTVSFWIIPWRIVATILGVVFGFIIYTRLIHKSAVKKAGGKKKKKSEYLKMRNSPAERRDLV